MTQWQLMNHPLSWLMMGISLSFPLFGNSLSVSGNPATLQISSIPSVGGNPASVTNNSTTYTMTALVGGASISGQLDHNTPSGLTLKIALAAPLVGGTSTGTVALSTTPVALVTNIPIISIGLASTITYTLDATVAAAPQTGSVVVTYTLQ